MEVILDSSFIISCIKKNIDFVSQLEEQGFKILLAHEILDELKDLRKSNRVSHDDRVSIDLALEMFSNKKFKKTKLGHYSVDDGLIKRGKEGIYIASLDKVIKREVPNKVVIFDSTKSVGVVRD